ncbi:hypothetical protein [Hamadaea tsunoensis]|uniref:hypothetical protein n=1 Tax=Hamadaea tsunoensis TaxID=53368 RepID=UPI000487DDE9|nr:hypothetical protein [Hamadaea tsunoensis]
MNLVQRLLGVTHKQRVPAWASESTVEVAIVRHHNASTAWTELNTGLLHTVATGLADGRPYWHAISGEIVWEGNKVVTDIDPSSVGVILGAGRSPQLAEVMLVAGPGAGQVQELTPGRIMRRLPN